MRLSGFDQFAFGLFFLTSFQSEATSNQLFIPTTIDPKHKVEIQKEVRSVSFFTLDQNLLKRLYQSGEPNLELEIPGQTGQTEILKLNRVEVATSEFFIRTSGKKIFTEPFEKAIHYQGMVVGTPKSLAAISFTSKAISGIFSFGTGNFNLVKLRTPERNKAIYALFNDTDILRKNPFLCHSDDLSGNKNKSKNLLPDLPQEIVVDNCRRVELYFECDHQMFLDNGSSVPNTVNFVTSLFNVVSAIYAQTGVVTRISETKIHTQPDDYPTVSSAEALYAFGDSIAIRQPFNGDLAHLLSTVPNANGGRAYLDVLCSKGTGYSNIYPSFLPLPYYSWDVNVVTHELGHNFGSPHTQSCSWETSPGVFTMLDSCYFAEGDCYEGPRIASVGTQMSYCHLMNLGIDMSKGFGPLPGTLIRNNYLNSSCLNGSVELPPLFITKPDTFCSGANVNLNVTSVAGATYLWSGPNAFSSTIANPVLTNINPNQAGTYSVVVSKGSCSSVVMKTEVAVNCIYTIPQTNRSQCLPGVFSVDFISSIQPNPATNYTVQLSNAAGSFANPTAIGSITSGQNKGTIPVSLPNGFPADSGFLVRIISTNPASVGLPNSQKLKFNTTPVEPVAADVNHCQSGTFQLSASASGLISWYNSATATTELATGNTFTTPSLSSTTSYWVGSQQVKKERIGPIVDLNSNDTLVVNNTYHGLFIKVKKTLVIDSITVYPNGPGMLHFNIKDSTNTFIYKTVLVPVTGNILGEKIKIGVEMSPGVYRIDAEASTIPGLLRLNNYFNYPLISEGMNILGSSVGSRYYFFYDWKIRSFGCPSKRKEVKAIITNPPNSPGVQSAGRCGAGSLTLSASGATAGQTYKWYTTSSGGTAIPGQSASSFTTPVLASSTTYYVSILGLGNCESARQPVIATILSVPPTPTISLSNGYLIASTDTVFEWYRNNVLVGTFGDSLQHSLYGDGSYYAILKRANGCTAQSNTILITEKTELIAEHKQIHVFPNPGRGLFTVEMAEPSLCNYQIFDSQGRRIVENHLTESSKAIDLQAFASGIYTLKIYTDRFVEVIRLRKE